MKRLILLSLLLPFTLNAQNDEPKKHIRLIPLGERPTSDFKIVNGVRIEQEYPEGSVPPAELTLQTDADAGKELNLRLREFTDFQTLKASVGGIKLYEGKAIGGKAWQATGFSGSQQSLGILFRDLKEMSWLTPRMMVLPDDIQSFPAGAIRFVNVSDREVAVIIDEGKPFQLAPGKMVVKALKVGENALQLAAENAAKGFDRILTNNISLGQGQRVQAFFYKGQGKTPVKFLAVPEVYASLEIDKDGR